jgi:hypothetical protein
VSWDYGRLVAEVYELDKPVGSTFPALRYYTRQLAGVTGRLLDDAGFADISVTADYREDRQPGPHSQTWTFHAVRPR